MAYGLPARGQQNWDDELNNSIEALRADVESTVSKAAVAASDAAYARNRADEVHTAILGGTDAAVSGFINDDTSATKASLSATYATRGVAAFRGLKMTLAAAAISTGVQVLGDSTGNEAGEWPRLMLAHLAAAQPALTFRELLWSDASQDFTRTTIQTGTAGALYANCDGTATERTAPYQHITGTIDVRAHIRATDYTPAAAKMITGSPGNSTARSWFLCMDTTGALVLMYSTDGAAVATMTSTANLATADNTDVWVRAVFNPNDGAGNRVAKFYTSADGVTWTQLGATVTTVGTVTLFNPGAGKYFNLGGVPVGSYGRFVGRIYEVQIRNGEGGGTVAACVPDLWADPSGTAAPIVGAPVVTLVNGSHPGAGLTYLNDSTRLPKMTPDYGQAVTILSDSHNESKVTGSTFTALYDAWRVAVAARVIAPQVILTQNPQSPAAANDVEHGIRRLNLLTYGPSKQVAVIDTYQTFLDNPDWLAQWMADTVHPNALGQAAWWDTIKAEYDPL